MYVCDELECLRDAPIGMILGHQISKPEVSRTCRSD